MTLQQEITLFKNHGTSTGFWTATAFADDQAGKVVISHAKKLDGKVVSREYLVEKKNVGRSNETTFIMQAVFEIQSRANKQRDKGYVDTVEAAAAPVVNTLGLSRPMLATPIEKVKAEQIDWENAYAQPKLDGHRCLVNGMLYSRQGKEILLPHIREALGDYGLLDKKLDGELYVHGELLQDIGSLIKKPREDSLKLSYYVYDIMSPAPYAERRAELEQMLDKASLLSSALCLVTTLAVTTRQELDSIHKTNLGCGYEGTMLRHGLEGYADGKRSRSLLKVKDFQDAEFRVVGVERGKPNGEFEVPVWVCETPEGKEFRVTAQGDMQWKHTQWENRDYYIGDQLTVQFFGVSKDGIPLLPVALRWREDV